jgi:hypothetical protein
MSVFTGVYVRTTKTNAIALVSSPLYKVEAFSCSSKIEKT